MVTLKSRDEKQRRNSGPKSIKVKKNKLIKVSGELL